MLAIKDITDSALYTTEAVISGIVSVLFYLFIANYLSLEEVGAYSLAIVYASILAGIANFALVSGYERNFFEYDQNPEQKGSLLTTVQLFVLLSMTLFVMLGIGLADTISQYLFGNIKYSKLWVLILIGISVSEFSKYYFTFLKNSRRPKLFLYLRVTQVCINFGLSYFFLVILNKDIAWLGVSLLIGHIIVVGWSCVHQFRELPHTLDLNAFKEVAKISLPLTPKTFIGFIGTQFDKIIISLLSTLDAVAVYTIAQRLAMSTYMIMNALGRVFQPRLFESLFHEGSKRDTSFLLTYMFISFIPVLILILFSKEIFFLFPQAYEWGHQILIVLCLFYAILYIGKINGPQLVFAKKTWLTSGLSLMSILLNIGITYPLVLSMGAIGAAIGTASSALVAGLAGFYFAQKYAYLEWDYKKMFFCYLYVIFSSCLVLYLEYLAYDFNINTFIKVLALFVFVYQGHAWRIIDIRDITKKV